MSRAASPARAAGLTAVVLEHVGVRLGHRRVLHDVFLELRAGQRWLLEGPNGAGKTVLLRLLRGEVWPTPTGRERRCYWLDGEWHDQPLMVRDRIAYLGPEQQDRYERYDWNLRVAEVVTTGLFDTDIPLDRPSRSQLGAVRRALQEVGLAGLARRRFLTLSQGQRRRVLLARALVRRPDLLLLDEALNGLDAPSRAAFLRALRRAAARGTTWMLATHRAADRPADLTHVARLEQGRLVVAEAGSSKCRRPSTAAHPHRPRTAVPAAGATAAGRGAPLVLIESASVYREQSPIIAGLDWAIHAGEHWCITGPNGCGKSTLMALLYGDLSPALGGRVLREGCPPGVSIEEWKQHAGLVSPELQASYAATACPLDEIVVSGFHSSIGLNRRPRASELVLARKWLARVGLAGLGRRRARQVSYGQLRLALLARALVRPRRLLLLDEPFDGLDARSRTVMSREIDAAVARGAQVVLATHHVEDVPPFVRHRLELAGGRARVRRTGQGSSLRSRRASARRGAASSSRAAETGVTVT